MQIIKNVSCAGKYQEHIPCSFAYKIVCIDDRLNKPVVLYRGKNTVYEFIAAILKECEYYKRVVKRHFNKNLAVTVDDGKDFK